MPDLVTGYPYEVLSRADLQPLVKPLIPAVFAETGYLSAGYACTEAKQGALWRLEADLAARVQLSHRFDPLRRKVSGGRVGQRGIGDTRSLF